MIQDVIVLGGGAAGIMAAISSASDGKNVLLLEKMPQIALKLKATGGGRCNLTNTLASDDFMQKFGKNGRFLSDALKSFSKDDLQNFFASIGVKTIARDGFRIFPESHNSAHIIEALTQKLQDLNVKIITSIDIINIKKEQSIFYLDSKNDSYKTKKLIIATGGLGYPSLGASGDGYKYAKIFNHTITKTYPAMMPLLTKERNFANCKAHTIAKAILKIEHKKYKNLKLSGDLIFSKNALRGPLVLDFAREITPLLNGQNELKVLISFLKGKNEDEIFRHIKEQNIKKPNDNILQNITSLLPECVANELLLMAQIDKELRFKHIDGKKRELLLKTLAWTPFHIIGHDGFKEAMITRGGISIKEIDPKTMQSRVVDGLYFCGEVMDIDGPCGGYNLQWAFSSGFLAGKLKSTPKT